MATIRDILKGFFSSGKKPTEAQFHELIDSYIHKTEDGLIMGEEGNFGVNTLNPEAALHVGGGLKIGEPADLSLATSGTLRWNGAQLQILFDNGWQDVWPPKPVTINTKEESLAGVAKEFTRTALTFTTPTFNFPVGAEKLLHFNIDYEHTEFIGSTLTFTLVTHNNSNFHSDKITSKLDNAVKQKFPKQFTDKTITSNGTFFFRFVFQPSTEKNAFGFFKRPNASIRIRAITITTKLK